MAAVITDTVPQGFEPDPVPNGFEPDEPQGFEPDSPSFTQSLTSDLSSGQPERISRAGQAIANQSLGMVGIGLAAGEQQRRREIDEQASLQPVGTGSESLAPKPAPAAPEQPPLMPSLREAVQYASTPFLPLEAAGEFATKLGQDIVSKLTGDPRYGGNIKAWVENPEQQSPAERFIAESAKDAPTTAFFANLGKQVSEMSPMLGMGAAPGVAGRLVSGGFAGTMGLSFYDAAVELEHELAKPKEQQDAGKIAELKASVVSSGLFGALATVHSAGPRRAPVPERPETLAAQLKLVQDGTKPAMLVTPGEVMPKIPEGFEILVAGDRGTIIFDPKIVSPEQVRRLVNLGEEGMAQLLGFGATKEQAAATGPTAVLETKVGNVPVQQEAVSDATLPAAVDASKKTVPGGTTELKPTEQVVTERLSLSPADAIRELQLEGVTKSDAEALVAGTKTVKEVVEGNFKVTPSRVVGAEQGHDEAFVEGYNQAIERLGDILDRTKPPQPKSPNETQKEKGQAQVLGEETAGVVATPGAPLGPAAGSTPLTPKSQRQIITDIAKGLGIPIRFGRLTTPKFGGYFKSIANLIGSKRADDIPVVSHEAGHKLDSTFRLSNDPALRSELDVLGDPATPGSRSSWTRSKTRKYKLGEGVAEFVRYWLTDPAQAQRVAPNTFTAFERALDANKDFGDTMRQAQQDIAVWRNSEPQARLRSQISVGENPNKTPYTASQLTRDLVDDLHILRLAVLDAAPRGSSLPPSLDPYLLARNLRGSYGMADTFIRNGIVDFKTKAVQLGKSLEDALKPVAGRLNDFRDWIVAKRAQELRAQGRESGLVSSDVDAVAARFDGDADFQQAFADVKAWNDSLLKYAEDSGLLTAESVAAMRRMNQDYVPFHRVFEVGAGEAPSQQAGGIGMGLNVGKPGSLKGLKGSPRQIVDPLETMVKNAYTIITASEKAAINLAVADLSKLPGMGKWVERIAAPKEQVRVELERIRQELEAAGADLTNVPDDLLLSFFRQSRRAPFGENVIRVTRDGKDEFYRLNRDLHDTFQALDLEDTGKLVRMLASPAQLLRAGVVLEPSFSFANVLRDTFSAAVIGKYGALPFETTLRGLFAMVNNPKVVAEWAAAGGKSAVEASYFDRAKLQKFLAERISKDLTPAERALIVTRSPLSALRWLSSTFEEATRVGEYQIAYNRLQKAGMPQGEARRLAAFEARDRQDFAKGGAKTKIVRHLAAFWNAALQANVKLLQAFKERPVRTTLQGLAFITIPKLIEQAINWDDEDYWARKQWERDMFFLIPIGKGKDGHTQFLRIPTPFEVGVIFGTFPGRVLQSMREQNKEAMKGFPSLMLKQSVPNPIPQALQVVFEDFLSGKKGWDVWRGRTIVPESLADEPPELQYTEQTSAIARKAGQALKFSPMKVDHLIERTTGGMGKLLTGRAVPGQRFVTAPLTVSNQATETFYDRLEAIREDAGRAKAANNPMPPQFGAFTAFERRLTNFRRAIRGTTDLDRKTQIQNEMLSDTTEFLKNHPKPQK